jgi:hypothetical protein
MLCPMRVFARLIKHPFDIPIESPQHADARMHQRSTIFCGHDQRLDRGLPRFKILFGLRKLHDVVGGIAQSHQLAPTRQQDRIIEGTSPGGNGLQLCDQLSVFRDVPNVQFALFSAASTAAIAGPIVALS